MLNEVTYIEENSMVLSPYRARQMKPTVMTGCFDINILIASSESSLAGACLAMRTRLVI